VIEAFLISRLASPQGEILGVEEELRIVLHPDLPDAHASGLRDGIQLRRLNPGHVDARQMVEERVQKSDNY
jgi:hypothetical protein